MDDTAFTCFTSCYKCNRRIKIECYDDNFETEENATFLGRLGTRTYSYCPYCGTKESGFSPYCGTKESGFSPYDPEQKIDLSLEDDPEEYEIDDEEPSWWPDAEGVTLIDDDEEEEEKGDPWEMDDEALLWSFTCPSCGGKFRLNPKGSDKIYCYYCGKESTKE